MTLGGIGRGVAADVQIAQHDDFIPIAVIFRRADEVDETGFDDFQLPQTDGVVFSDFLVKSLQVRQGDGDDFKV